MSTYLFINELKQGRGLDNINSIIIDFLRSNGIVAVQPESNPDIKIEIDQYGYLRVNNHSIDKIPIMVKESFPPRYQYPEMSDEKKSKFLNDIQTAIDTPKANNISEYNHIYIQDGDVSLILKNLVKNKFGKYIITNNKTENSIVIEVKGYVVNINNVEVTRIGYMESVSTREKKYVLNFFQEGKIVNHIRNLLYL